MRTNRLLPILLGGVVLLVAIGGLLFAGLLGGGDEESRGPTEGRTAISAEQRAEWEAEQQRREAEAEAAAQRDRDREATYSKPRAGAGSDDSDASGGDSDDAAGDEDRGANWRGDNNGSTSRVSTGNNASSGSGRSYSSRGSTWRRSGGDDDDRNSRLGDFQGQPGADGEEEAKPEVPTELPRIWRVNLRDTRGNAINVPGAMFAPRPPHELRADGLYGDGRFLPAQSIPAGQSGTLQVTIGQALTALGLDPSATLASLGGWDAIAGYSLGIHIDVPQYEPIVTTLPLRQHPDESAPTITLTDAHRVQIEVREEVARTPIPDAEVELWRYDPANPDTRLDILTLRTDSVGRITSRIMPGRNYAFRIEKQGFATSETERFQARSADEHYNVPLYKGNFLGGRVTDQEGAPIPGATVTAAQQGNDGFGEESVSTNTYGEFVLTSIPHSDFTSQAWVTVAKEGYAMSVSRETVNSNEAVLVLTREAGFIGIVAMADGSAVPMPCEVYAEQRLYGDRTVRFGPFEVAQDGTFAVNGMTAGSCQLVAQCESGHTSAPATIQYNPQVPSTGEPQVTLELQPPARLFVTATRTDGTPIEDLPLRVGEWEGRTDTAGTILWEQLAPGEERLFVAADEAGGQTVTAAGVQYFVPDAQNVQLVSDRTIEATFQLSVYLPPSSVTAVEVRFMGDPVVNSPGDVTVDAAIQGSGTERTGGSVPFQNGVGTYSLNLRGDATHQLQFVHPDYESVTVNQETLAAAAQRGEPAVVTLTRVPSIQIQVVDPGGTQVEEVGVELFRGGNRVGNRDTDGAGRVLFTHLVAGEYRIVAFKHGYRRTEFTVSIPMTAPITPIEHDDGSRLETASLGTGTAGNPSELRLTISNAGDATVTVTTMNGAPATGARILLMRRQSANRPLQIFDLGTLDGQGSKVVRLHWDVEYQMIVFTSGEIAYAHFFNDPAEPIYRLDLTMEPRGTISGRVENPNGSRARNVEVRLVPTSGALAGSQNYFATRTNNQGNWSIPVPLGTTFQAILPDEQGTTPVDNLAAGSTGVTIRRGE